MTTRKLNYTGCVRIRRSDVQINLDTQSDGPPRFSPAWDLDKYEFPGDAQIVVEVQAHWTLMRFGCGSLSEPTVSAALDLTEFETPDGLLFRFKVIGSGAQAGLILGEADGIRPAETKEQTEGQSFLAVQPADLGDVAWQLSFAGSEPLLLVNDRLGDWRSFMRRADVRALVIPEVYRQLLREAASNAADAESLDAWQTSVLAMVPAGAGARPPYDDSDAVETWIIEAVRIFARRHRLFHSLAGWMGGET